MSVRTVVVDGSNIATEGRQMPSLKQLDEAVRAYREEHPDVEMIVVVDATFAHRIPEDERELYEEAAAHNELVYPPAGAIGRGDAFLLRIAEKTGAVVLSNDSFQEFHGEHDWLFEKGRLVGGTPVPGVGWIFVARTPVRGPKSREAVKEAKRTRARIGSKAASQPMPVPTAPPPARAARKKAAPVAEASVPTAIAVATEEAVTGEDADRKPKRRKRRGRGGEAAPAANLPTLNEPLTFIEFIAEHKLGSTIDGEVESFASHGAFVLVGAARCYIPLSGMGDPAPRSAREVLRKGETRPFVVQALDAARRGIELALPGYEHVAGQPTEETVEAEIEEAPAPVHREDRGAAAPAAGAGKRAKRVAGTKKAAAAKPAAAEMDAAAKKAAAKKSAAEKGAVKKVAATSTAKRAAGPPAMPAKAAAKAVTKKQAAAARKAAEQATATKKAVAKKAAAQQLPPKKAAAKKAAAPGKKAAVAKGAATKKVAAPAKKAAKKAATKATTTAKKTTSTVKKAAKAAKKSGR